jgi:cyclohexa-1,5-dienecarbonyl-CoA hydratase
MSDGADSRVSGPGVRVERDGRAATLWLERPPLNVLDLAALQALDGELARLAGEPGLDVLVVRGAGERAFSAGVAIQDHVGDRIPLALGAFHSAVRRLRELPAIAVAAVHGHCLGGGLELALACDLVVASDDSRFSLPEIQLACYPPVAAALLPRLLGRQRAMDLLLTARGFDAGEAERLGMLSRRAPAGGLGPAVAELVAALLGQSGIALRLAKRAVVAGEPLPFPEALAAAERLYLEELAGTADMNEGIAAFLARRAPVWQHR